MSDNTVIRTRAPRRLTGILLAVAIPLSLLLTLVAWAFASPVGASPDDDYHMASIWCGQGLRDDLCEAGEAADERRVPLAIYDSVNCFAFNSKQSASCPVASSDVLVNTDRGNFAGSYPPVYYGVMSVFAGPDIGASILTMRVVNAVLFVGMVVALFVLLPRTMRPSLLWPVLITSIPLGLFLIPSVNPSSWALLSATGLWLAVVGYATAERRSRQIVFGALALVLTVIGAGARSDSAIYAGLAVAVAGLMTFEPSRRWILRAILPVGLVLVALAFFLLSGQSGVAAPGGSSGSGHVDGPVYALAALVELPSLWSGALGTWGLGWLDTEMPPIVWFPTIFVFAAVVFIGLRNLPWRKASALGLAFFALIAIPLYVLVNDQVRVGAGVQPRYILPMLIIVVGVVVWEGLRGPWRLTRFQRILIGVLLIVSQTIALQVNLRRYVTGDDVYSPNLDAGAEWWWPLPFGPNWVWAIGSVAFAAAAAGLLLAIDRADRAHPFALEAEAASKSA